MYADDMLTIPNFSSIIKKQNYIVLKSTLMCMYFIGIR